MGFDTLDEVYIDPTNGDDETALGTIDLPWKTHAAFAKALGNQLVNPTGTGTREMVVHILGDCPSTDTFLIAFNVRSSVVLSYKGTSAIVSSGVGTFTGVIAKDRASNTPPQIIDSARGSWTPGQRLRITGTGPNAGAIAWVLKDQGGGSVRTTDWQTQVALPGTNPTSVTPAIGDPYVIETLPTIFVGDVRGTGFIDTPDSYPSVGFTDLAIDNVFGDFILSSASCSTYFVNSLLKTLPATLGGSQSFYLGCCFLSLLISARGGTSYIFGGGGIGSALTVYQQGVADIDFDFIGQDFPIVCYQGGAVDIGTAGFFDTSTNNCPDGSAINISIPDAQDAPADVTNLGYLSGVQALWGSGNLGHGIAVGINSSFGYENSIPTLTGTLGDFRLSAEVTETSGVAYDSTTFVQSLPFTCTWANLADPLVFDGSAHNPRKNAHIVQK